MNDDSTPPSAPSAHNPYAPPLAAVTAAPGEPAAPVAETELATRSMRLWAVIAESLLMIPAALAFGLVWLAADGFRFRPIDEQSVGTIVVVSLTGVGILVAWWVVTWVWMYRYGQNIGKRLVGLRVVRTDGTRVSFGRYLGLRGIVSALPGFIPLIGNFWGFVDSAWIFGEQRRCLHDLIADTKVVTAASSEHATLAAVEG